MKFAHPGAFMWNVVLALLICLFYPGALSLAQIGRAEIVGEVRDQNGSGVLGAQIIIVDAGNSNKIPLTSAPHGAFTATNLSPGTYAITVEASSFRRLVRDGVSIATGERLRLA